MLGDIAEAAFEWATTTRQRAYRLLGTLVVLVLVCGVAVLVVANRPVSAEALCAASDEAGPVGGALSGSDRVVFARLAELGSKSERLSDDAPGPVASVHAAGARLSELADRDSVSLLDVMAGLAPVQGYCQRLGSYAAASAASAGVPRAGSAPPVVEVPAAHVPTQPEPAVTGPCSYVPGEEASRPVAAPPSTPTVVGRQTATMQTNRGTITFTLLGDAAPCATQSFVSLAEQDFYDDTPCHRLTEGSLAVLQCGDPTGTGTGGPGYSFGEENVEGATYPRGTVAMAKSAAPSSTGSQFFLVHGDSELPPKYTVVGQITQGLDVLQAIADAGVGEADENGNTAPEVAVQVTDLSTTAG